ncbi:MAG: hypothetical protein AB1817_11510 [Chloroflexota bacterium]
MKLEEAMAKIRAEQKTKAAPNTTPKTLAQALKPLTTQKDVNEPKQRSYDVFEIAAFVADEDHYDDLARTIDKALAPYKSVLYCERIKGKGLGETRFLIVARR